jgi:hypothetical protein
MRNLLTVIFILIGCSSFPKKDQSDFSFQNVKQLKIGQTTLSEIVNTFGEPAEVARAEGSETWTYKDHVTNYQRLTVTLNSSSILQSVVWLPLPNEEETSLQKIKGRLPQSNFKKVPAPDDNPHSISSMTSYVDEKLGMTLLYQNGRNTVEAVVWTDNSREPATYKELSGIIPYTIDN